MLNNVNIIYIFSADPRMLIFTLKSISRYKISLFSPNIFNFNPIISFTQQAPVVIYLKTIQKLFC